MKLTNHDPKQISSLATKPGYGLMSGGMPNAEYLTLKDRAGNIITEICDRNSKAPTIS